MGWALDGWPSSADWAERPEAFLLHNRKIALNLRTETEWHKNGGSDCVNHGNWTLPGMLLEVRIPAAESHQEVHSFYKARHPHSNLVLTQKGEESHSSSWPSKRWERWFKLLHFSGPLSLSLSLVFLAEQRNLLARTNSHNFFFSFHFCNYHCLVHSPPYWVFAIISLKRVLDWIGLFMPNPNEGNKKKKLWKKCFSKQGKTLG